MLDTDEEQKSLGIRLLTDIQKLFGTDRSMTTFDILKELTGDEESEWFDLFGDGLESPAASKGVEAVRSQAEGNQYRVDDGAWLLR